MLNLGPVILYILAGFCVYLAVLNRHIVLLRDSKVKTPLMVGTFLVAAGGSALAGLLLPRSPWLCIPVSILVAAAIGEMLRLANKWRCRGSAPVDSEFHDVPLSRPFTTTDLACHRYRLETDKWEGDAFRVVHLSDLHATHSYPKDYYERVFALAEEQEPDFAFITGDFLVDQSALDILSDVIRPLGKAGCYAVLGNHDYWAAPEAVAGVVTEAGITLLVNESVHTRVAGDDLLISGCDDPWGKTSWSPPTTDKPMLHLALSHTPDNIYRLARAGLDCVFCGHYHAGQFRIPGLGAFVIPSVYGRRFDHGHYRVRGTDMFIAAGVGATNPPFRLYCRPDIFVVDILPGVC